MYRHFRTFHWEELAEDGSSEEHDIPIYKPMITETVACTFLECPQSYVGLCLMWQHFRLSHSEELAEDCSSKEHGIHTIPPPPITRPNSLKSHITEKHYQYIVKMVGRHIEHDIINLKFTAHHEYLKSLLANPIARHKLAKEIVEVLIEKTMLTADAIDDAGGNLPDGIILEPYGGVLRLTLDRKDNNLPHFLEGLPVAENIHFVALGMNTSANIVCLHGPDTCKKLRAKVEESKRATPESHDIIVSEQQDARCYDENKLYCTSAGVYRKENDFYKQYKNDKKMVTDGDVVALEKFNSKYPTEVVEAMNQFRLEFPTPKSVYDFGLSLFTKKKGKCAISKFLMINDKGNNIYQPSLDAIFPNQRHVKSNLRLICRFLNSTSVSKCSKDGQTDSGWTPAVFSSYIALPAQDKINN